MEYEGSRTWRGNGTEGRTIIEEGSTKLTNRFLTLHELRGMSRCHKIRWTSDELYLPGQMNSRWTQSSDVARQSKELIRSSWVVSCCSSGAHRDESCGSSGAHENCRVHGRVHGGQFDHTEFIASWIHQGQKKSWAPLWASWCGSYGAHILYELSYELLLSCSAKIQNNYLEKIQEHGPQSVLITLSRTRRSPLPRVNCAFRS